MHRGRAIWLAAVLAPSSSGCTLVFSTDGLDDGAPVSHPQSAPYCKSLSRPPSFCDDFDKSNKLDGWQIQQTAGYASVTLDTSSSLSAPRSLRTTTMQSDSFPIAAVSRIVTGPFTHVVFAFDLLVDQAEMDPMTAAILEVSCQLDVEITTDWVRISEVTSPTTTVDHGQVAFGATPSSWSRLELDFDGVANPPLLTLKIDDVTPQGYDQLQLKSCPSMTGDALIYLGNYYSSGSWMLHFDNVFVDGNTQ